MNHTYAPRQELRPKSLNGISDEQIAQHWSLYEGYVKNVNALNEEISALAQKSDFGLKFAELKRRLGFEYDGMILHEHYFGILKGGQKPLGPEAELTKHFKRCFGGLETWKKEFSEVGKMRGVGWAILYYDPHAKILSNHWIDLHDHGHPAGFAPLLVMDVWEHAFLVDWNASQRADYIEAFFQNVDWPKVERHLQEAARAVLVA